MNADDLLDLAIGQVDADRREALEFEAAADPATAETLRRLTRRLESLLDDGLSGVAPPRDLVSRTMARVTEHRDRRKILEFAPVRVPFRWADVAVAAGIFLAGVLTLLPAAQRGRARVNQAACAFNLQQLGFGLHQYSQSQGSYPYVSAKCPASRAGAFAILLNDVGLLHGVASLDCPGNGVSPYQGPLPPFECLSGAEAKAPRTSPCLNHLDYAYSLGYQRQPGRPGPVPTAMPTTLQATVPLLADKPACDGACHVADGNSRNHNLSGQNVLFTDGHVSWRPTRRLGPLDDDMYLNAQHHAAPGRYPHDSVLAPGTFRFDGEY